MGQQNGVEDETAPAGEVVAVGSGAFANEAVRAEQAQLAADRGRAFTLFGFGLGRGGVEQRLQIAIAKAIDLELTAKYGLE